MTNDVGITLIVSLGLSLALAQPPLAEERIRTQIEHLRQFNTLSIGTAQIASTKILTVIYERRHFKRLWTHPRTIEDLLRTIHKSEEDGLNPADYHLAELIRLHTAVQATPEPSPQQLADLDILRTDALIRLSYHLLFGKVNPERLDGNWSFSHDIQQIEPIAALQTMIDSDRLYQVIEALKPQHSFYVQLKTALAQYRTIQAAGGWSPLPPDLLHRTSMTNPHIPLLRQRLVMTGDLSPEADPSSAMFDNELEAAVVRFQHRHRLSEDGVLGPITLAALNIPVAQRIDQLRVNLERARWVLQNLPSAFVVVNIAGFKVYLVHDGVPVWETRAVVGSTYHQSPVFKAEMTYIVLNPTWTVPRGITVQEILPKAKRDPTYLQDRNFEVVDGSGRVVDPNEIDWLHVNRHRFPYILRQAPGLNNALGQVKFIFPNRHSVYLHDTPNRSLFRKPMRNFSHGCIRVQNPLKLAELVLDNPDQWNAATIREAVASGKTQTIFLPEPLPVLLLYWTAEVGRDGAVYFLRDVYGRDPTVLSGLQSR